MVDEGFIRKVKYGIITFILIVLQVYLLIQEFGARDGYTQSMYNFFTTILWFFLAYFIFRFLIILFMDRNRFLEAIDVLLTRLNNGLMLALERMAKSNNNGRYTSNRRVERKYYSTSNYPYKDRRDYQPTREYDPITKADRAFIDADRDFSNRMRKADNSFKEMDRDFSNRMRKVERDFRKMDQDFSNAMGDSKKKGRKGDFW